MTHRRQPHRDWGNPGLPTSFWDTQTRLRSSLPVCLLGDRTNLRGSVDTAPARASVNRPGGQKRDEKARREAGSFISPKMALAHQTGGDVSLRDGGPAPGDPGLPAARGPGCLGPRVGSRSVGASLQRRRAGRGPGRGGLGRVWGLSPEERRRHRGDGRRLQHQAAVRPRACHPRQGGAAGGGRASGRAPGQGRGRERRGGGGAAAGSGRLHGGRGRAGLGPGPGPRTRAAVGRRGVQRRRPAPRPAPRACLPARRPPYLRALGRLVGRRLGGSRAELDETARGWQCACACARGGAASGRSESTKPASRRGATGSGEEQNASGRPNALKGLCAARASCLKA